MNRIMKKLLSLSMFVYDIMILLHSELIELLKADTKRIKAATEVMKAANKVFENKGV